MKLVYKYVGNNTMFYISHFIKTKIDFLKYSLMLPCVF